MPFCRDTDLKLIAPFLYDSQWGTTYIHFIRQAEDDILRRLKDELKKSNFDENKLDHQNYIVENNLYESLRNDADGDVGFVDDNGFFYNASYVWQSEVEPYFDPKLSTNGTSQWTNSVAYKAISDYIMPSLIRGNNNFDQQIPIFKRRYSEEFKLVLLDADYDDDGDGEFEKHEEIRLDLLRRDR